MNNLKYIIYVASSEKKNEFHTHATGLANLTRSYYLRNRWGDTRFESKKQKHFQTLLLFPVIKAVKSYVDVVTRGNITFAPNCVKNGKLL